MTLEELFDDGTLRMDKAYESFVDDMSGVRTGRVSSKLVEDLAVEAYGSTMVIKELATISIPEPQMLVVQPWDKTVIQAIDKAIRMSDLNLSPVADGAVLRVPIPALTEERRKELTKVLSKKAEESRVAVRNIRRDMIDQLSKMKKNSDISEDDEKRDKEKIQKLTDATIAKIEEILKVKTEELETV